MIDRKFFSGVTFLVAIGLVIALTLAMYNNVFRQTEPLTVVADRAGLTLRPQSPVKLHGVRIGRVERARRDGDTVKVDLNIEPDALEKIPADATAQIVPPTAFGNKYVQLTDPSGADSASITAGAVIEADRVTTEVNTAFENLTHVLGAARPDDVNNALTALATATDGRGRRIGNLVGRVNSYLGAFNPSLDTLSQDVHQAEDVLGVYNRALPDLLATADSTTTTSNTLVTHQGALNSTLGNLTSFSTNTDRLLARSQAQLRSSLSKLAPVTSVLSRYSPELPCVVLGLAGANQLAENAVGGTNPGITTTTRIVPGRDPYQYPEDLPALDGRRGPGCYGLPEVTPQEAQQNAPDLGSGTDPYQGPPPTARENLGTTLFGALAGLENLR